MEGMWLALIATDKPTEKEKESRSSNIANQLSKKIQVPLTLC